ncbi:MAG: (Fe-S)-binding protein [Deltaproteobacteria bacterium]|nr:(Fe-S)-binding protein [Deltaproteobacteria bacterium]
MGAEQKNTVDQNRINRILERQETRMKMYLSHCVHCSLCAESCFLYMSNNRDPKYMPSYKVINSLGKMYRKKGKIRMELLEDMKEIVWKSCVLCQRCYCPVGVDIPAMISLARSVCRSQGVFPGFDEAGNMESWL